jgi:hypothetical protein
VIAIFSPFLASVFFNAVNFIHARKPAPAGIMGNGMMIPAQGRNLVIAVIVAPPVIAHTDSIHMMDIRRSAADAASPVPDALD